MSASAPVPDDFTGEGKNQFYPNFPHEQNQGAIQQHPPPPGYFSTQQQYLQTQGVPLAGMTSYGQPAPPPVSVIHVQSPGVSGCPNCHSNSMETEFTVCGILCAICCFPIGLLCCYMWRRKRCVTCGSRFG